MYAVDEHRTVVVIGVPDILPSLRMADKLVIHFQSSRSNGGDVDKIHYPTNFKGVAFVTFENREDAERVVRKEQKISDKEFPTDYSITVFKFTADVFFYCNAEVNLSGFRDSEMLIQSLQAVHRSVRICSLPRKRATVEGPFNALKALREDLISRSRANSSDSWMEQGALSSPDSCRSSVAGSAQAQWAETSQDGREDDDDEEELAEDSLWVDTCTFIYIQKFHQEALDRCLQEHGVSARFEEGSDLTLVHLRGRAKGQARVRRATEAFNALVSAQHTQLRVHILNHTSHDRRERQRLLQICDEASGLYSDILYIPLDACLKVVGPSTSSYLFYDYVRCKANSVDQYSSLTTP